MKWYFRTKNFLIIEALIVLLNSFSIQEKIWPLLIKGECPLPSPFPAFTPCADKYILGAHLFFGGLFWTYIVLFIIYKLIKYRKHD